MATFVFLFLFIPGAVTLSAGLFPQAFAPGIADTAWFLRLIGIAFIMAAFSLRSIVSR